MRWRPVTTMSATSSVASGPADRDRPAKESGPATLSRWTSTCGSPRSGGTPSACVRGPTRFTVSSRRSVPGWSSLRAPAWPATGRRARVDPAGTGDGAHQTVAGHAPDRDRHRRHPTQERLDRWASEGALGQIERFPLEVGPTVVALRAAHWRRRCPGSYRSTWLTPPSSADRRGPGDGCRSGARPVATTLRSRITPQRGGWWLLGLPQDTPMSGAAPAVTGQVVS